MKFEKLFYVAISSVVIIAFILIRNISSPSGTSYNSNSLVKKIYFADHISAAHQKVIDKFNEKYKGQIEVVAINLPFVKFSTNERKELLARYLRSKSDRIDIFSVDQIWVPRFAKWAIPMEKYIPPSTKDNLLKYAMQSCYFNDTLVSVPLYIDIAIMTYRKDLLEKLPDHEILEKKIKESITWEDFISLQKRLGYSKNPYFLFQADDFEGLVCIFAELMANQNKPMIEDGKLQLNSEEAKRALQLLVDLVNKYNISPKGVITLKENTSYDYFISNDGVFLRGWTSFLSNDSRRSYNYNKIFDKLEPVPTPHFEGLNPVSVFGGWNLMISKFSTKIPEAVKFVNYLVSDEAQKIMYEEALFLPINEKIYKDSSYAKDFPGLQFYYSLLKRGFHRPFLENYTNISDFLSYYLNLAIRKELTVEDALKMASEKINSGSILIK
jgi:multiple sugar transport system substrate-binding protein